MTYLHLIGSVKNMLTSITVKLLFGIGFNITPPVRPNDYVYIIHSRNPAKVKVRYISLDDHGEFFFGTLRGKIPDNFYSCHFSVADIGRYVFLTEEEAWNSLKED